MRYVIFFVLLFVTPLILGSIIATCIYDAGYGTEGVIFSVALGAMFIAFIGLITGADGAEGDRPGNKELAAYLSAVAFAVGTAAIWLLIWVETTYEYEFLLAFFATLAAMIVLVWNYIQGLQYGDFSGPERS